MGEGYQQFLEGNYDSGKEEEQSKKDVAQAQRIYNTAQSLRKESREHLINMKLKDELLPTGDEEAIRELINEYALNKDKYLVNGAILTCNMAFTKSQVLRSVLYGSEINNEEVDGSRTLLKIPETNSYINGMPVATVKDHAIDTNIEPFKCNCLNIPDREEEWKAIESSEECKKYGTCQKLMSLEDDWENIINSTLYLSFNHSVDGQETERAQGITMNSMLFCRHGGIITPVTSGQPIIINGISKEAIRALMELEVLNNYAQRYLVIVNGKLIGIKPHLAGDGTITVAFGDSLQGNDLDFYLDPKWGDSIKGKLSDKASEFDEIKDTVVPVEICFAKLLQDIDSIYMEEISELDEKCSLSQNQIDALFIMKYQCYLLKQEILDAIEDGKNRDDLYDLVLERHGKNGGFESRTTVEMNIFYDANYKVEGGYDTVIVEPLENYEK